MSNSTPDRRSLLALFPGQPTPRPYDRAMEVPRTRHHSRRTEQAYCFGSDPTESEGGKQKAESGTRLVLLPSAFCFLPSALSRGPQPPRPAVKGALGRQLGDCTNRKITEANRRPRVKLVTQQAAAAAARQGRFRLRPTGKEFHAGQPEQEFGRASTGGMRRCMNGMRP
jgi:hypothetical protein